MSREEAYAVLGLPPGASDQEIRDRHLKLIAQLHPDRGGSNYLAARVNEARRVLLGK
jgi:curved DNA-binding protein CbpA